MALSAPMTKPTIIIPARLGSTRFPGKPLVLIHDKPLIQHVWEAAQRTGLPAYVATDDVRIADVVHGFGGVAVMTGECENGTERVAEAARFLGLSGPVVNWQGDSPCVPPEWITTLLAEVADRPTVVATPIQLCDDTGRSRIALDYRAGNVGATTVALRSDFRALYFSKAPIPHNGPLWLHVGVYAYGARALEKYGHNPAPTEKAEKLEQLRFLDAGVRVQCVPVEGPPIWEVNNPGDVPIVGGMLKC